MIERVSSYDSLTLFPPDRIRIEAETVYKNGAGDVFIQRQGSEHTALMVLLLGVMRLLILPQADTDELSCFIDSLGITDIVVSPEYAAVFKGFVFEETAVMRYADDKASATVENVHFAGYDAPQKLFSDIYALFFNSPEFFPEWYCCFMKSLSRNEAMCAYAVADDRVVSAAAVPYMSECGAVVSGVATLPEYRGRGLAGKCVRAVINAAPDTIYLRCKNSLCGFYENAGFVRCDEAFAGKLITHER